MTGLNIFINLKHIMKNRRNKTSLAACAATLLCMASLPAAAHVVLEYQVANAGSYYKATFKVGHGCGTSPVKQIVVTIPAGVQGAKPMPKAGWTWTSCVKSSPSPWWIMAAP